MKVKIKRVNAVAIWKWNVPNDDVCGICRVPFDGCCPDCHVPGDDCPILTGQCKHVFHMFDHCKWHLTSLGTVLRSGCIHQIRRPSVLWIGSRGVRHLMRDNLRSDLQEVTCSSYLFAQLSLEAPFLVLKKLLAELGQTALSDEKVWNADRFKL
jgi:anaphase-promoting complex subunit 11